MLIDVLLAADKVGNVVAEPIRALGAFGFTLCRRALIFSL